MDQKAIDALLAVRQSQLDSARPDIVARVRTGGRLTARERVMALLDEGSGVEYGSVSARTADGEWIAESGGVDYVGRIGGQTVIVSSTDSTDHGGGYGAGRLGRLFALAQEHRWPVVFFVDGGGSRARHPRVGQGHHEVNGPIGPYNLFDGMAELSGWVPTVAIVSGPSFAGHASLAGFSDIVIATGGSSIGMGGPPMVEAALGQRLTPHELAGVEMHETTGGIDRLVTDESEAVAVARAYLSYYHDEPAGSPSPTAAAIADFVADVGPYDMIPVITALVDDGTLFELRPGFARSVITALARIEGRTVGILANQPNVADGAIDELAATKVGRFVELCDVYDYPIVALVDTPGCVTHWTEGDITLAEPMMTRWHSRALLAHHHRSVPLFAIRVRRGRGFGPTVMAGAAGGRSVAVLSLAWPTAEVGRADGFAAATYLDNFDDVVAPVETRDRIAGLLGHLPRRHDQVAKKHPIDTW